MPKKNNQSKPSLKIKNLPSIKKPGGNLNGSVDGKKVSPPKKK
ncbi:hypothetical protein ACQKDB_12340 [Planococcus kocurii]